MIIRRERDGDAAAIALIHLAAFDSGDGTPAIEAGLNDALRLDSGFIAPLSLVAEGDGTVVGHVICTRGTVGPDGRAALGLGPLGVLPSYQGTGVGSALMHAVLGAADARDEPLVALLGNPDYYRRFGFVTSTEVGIDPPDAAWGIHFQARTLTTFDPAVHRGTFHYAAPFDDV